jgi:hypothetical protein
MLVVAIVLPEVPVTVTVDVPTVAVALAVNVARWSRLWGWCRTQQSRR